MVEDDFIYFKIEKTKHIALIAHDGKSRSWWNGPKKTRIS